MFTWHTLLRERTGTSTCDSFTPLQNQGTGIFTTRLPSPDIQPKLCSTNYMNTLYHLKNLHNSSRTVIVLVNKKPGFEEQPRRAASGH